MCGILCSWAGGSNGKDSNSPNSSTASTQFLSENPSNFLRHRQAYSKIYTEQVLGYLNNIDKEE